MNELVQTNCNTLNIETLQEKFIAYLDVSDSSVKSYSVGVRKFVNFLHANGITQPTRETVILYKQTLTARYSANSVALYLSALRRFFAWTETAGLYPNVMSGVKSPKISHEHKRDAFSAVELKRIISSMSRDSLEGMSRDSLEAKRNYAIFALISSCGLRTIEVVRANVGDIHRVAGVAVLDIQGKGHSSKDAFVKLTEPVMAAIREYLELRGEVNDNEPLFASCSRRNKGQRLTTRTISRRTISSVCKSAMIRAGFNSPRLTAHSLRHSAITIAILSGQTLDDVSAFARHSSIAITQIYNHSINRLKSRCESAISAVIFG